MPTARQPLNIHKVGVLFRDVFGEIKWIAVCFESSLLMKNIQALGRAWRQHNNRNIPLLCHRNRTIYGRLISPWEDIQPTNQLRYVVKESSPIHCCSTRDTCHHIDSDSTQSENQIAKTNPLLRHYLRHTAQSWFRSNNNPLEERLTFCLFGKSPLMG